MQNMQKKQFTEEINNENIKTMADEKIKIQNALIEGEEERLSKIINAEKDKVKKASKEIVQQMQNTEPSFSQSINRYFEEQFQNTDPYKVSLPSDLGNLIENKLFWAIVSKIREYNGIKDKVKEMDIFHQDRKESEIKKYEQMVDDFRFANSELLKYVKEEEDIEFDIIQSFLKSDDVKKNLYDKSSQNILSRFQNAYQQEQQTRINERLKEILSPYETQSYIAGQIVLGKYATLKSFILKLTEGHKADPKTENLSFLVNNILYNIFKMYIEDSETKFNINIGNYPFLNAIIENPDIYESEYRRKFMNTYEYTDLPQEYKDYKAAQSNVYFMASINISRHLKYDKTQTTPGVKSFEDSYTNKEILHYHKAILATVLKTDIESIDDDLHGEIIDPQEERLQAFNLYMKLAQELETIPHFSQTNTFSKIEKKILQDEKERRIHLTTHFDIWIIWQTLCGELSSKNVKIDDKVKKEMQFLFKQQKAIDYLAGAFEFEDEKTFQSKINNLKKKIVNYEYSKKITLLNMEHYATVLKDLLPFFQKIFYQPEEGESVSTKVKNGNARGFDIVFFLFFHTTILNMQLAMPFDASENEEKILQQFLDRSKNIFDNTVKRINQILKSNKASSVQSLADISNKFSIPQNFSNSNEDARAEFRKFMKSSSSYKSMQLAYDIEYSQLLEILEFDSQEKLHDVIQKMTLLKMDSIRSYEKTVRELTFILDSKTNPLGLIVTSNDTLSLVSDYELIEQVLKKIPILPSNETLSSLTKFNFSQSQIEKFIEVFTMHLNLINFPASKIVSNTITVDDFMKKIIFSNMKTFQRQVILSNIHKQQNDFLEDLRIKQLETETVLEPADEYSIFRDTYERAKISFFKIHDIERYLELKCIYLNNNIENAKEKIAKIKGSTITFNNRSIFDKSLKNSVKFELINHRLGNFLHFILTPLYKIKNILSLTNFTSLEELKQEIDSDKACFVLYAISNKNVFKEMRNYMANYKKALEIGMDNTDYNIFKKLSQDISAINESFSNIKEAIEMRLTNNRKAIQNINIDIAILKMQAIEAKYSEEKNGINPESSDDKENDILTKIDQFAQICNQYQEAMKNDDNEDGLKAFRDISVALHSKKIEIDEILKEKLSNAIFKSDDKFAFTLDEYQKILYNLSKIYHKIDNNKSISFSLTYQKDLKAYTNSLDDISQDLHHKVDLFPLVTITKLKKVNKSNYKIDNGTNYETQLSSKEDNCKSRKASSNSRTLQESSIPQELQLCNEIQLKLDQIQEEHDKQGSWISYNIGNIILTMSLTLIFSGFFAFDSSKYIEKKGNIDGSEEEAMSAIFLNIGIIMIGIRIIMSIFTKCFGGKPLEIEGVTKLTSEVSLLLEEIKVIDKEKFTTNQSKKIELSNNSSVSLTQKHQDTLKLFTNFISLTMPLEDINVIKKYLLQEKTRVYKILEIDTIPQQTFLEQMQDFKEIVKTQVKQMHYHIMSCNHNKQPIQKTDLVTIKYYNNILESMETYEAIDKITNNSLKAMNLIQNIFKTTYINRHIEHFNQITDIHEKINQDAIKCINDDATSINSSYSNQLQKQNELEEIILNRFKAQKNNTKIPSEHRMLRIIENEITKSEEMSYLLEHETKNKNSNFLQQNNFVESKNFVEKKPNLSTKKQL